MIEFSFSKLFNAPDSLMVNYLDIIAFLSCFLRPEICLVLSLNSSCFQHSQFNKLFNPLTVRSVDPVLLARLSASSQADHGNSIQCIIVTRA